MNKTAIMTDTNSGFTAAQAASAGLNLLPMPFMVDGELYLEGVDMTREQFYEQLSLQSEVSTSQPSPGDVISAWDKILRAGYAEIVYIPMSSGLSNSCESAIMMAAEYDGRVQVVNNHRISATLRQSVLDALKMADEGMCAADIRAQLEADAYQASIYIALDTLHYLKKGGRVTAAGAAIGTVLNIKPVLTIQGDKLDAFAKVRGMKAGRRTMIKAIEKDINEKFYELRAQKKLSLFVVYSHVKQDVLSAWISEVREEFPDMEVHVDSLTVSVGCHIGPGALAVAVAKRY